MTLPLTPEMLAHAYEYLCCTPPFNRWNMPPAEDVHFAVGRRRDRFAHHQLRDGVHHIELSSRWVGRHESLLSTLAHELIHLHMVQSCVRGEPHGPAFQRYADRVCKIHDFDRMLF